MPVRVGGEEEHPLVSVDRAGERVRGEAVAQRVGGFAHVGEVRRPPLLEGADRVFARRETSLRADALGGLAALRAVAEETADVFVLAPDLAALFLRGLRRQRDS